MRARVRLALSIYVAAILSLTAIALTIVWVRGSILHLPYPYNSLLFIPKERFSDLTHYYGKCWLFSHGGGFRGGEWPLWIYPAPSAYVQCFILNDTGHPVRVLIAISLAVAFIPAILFWRLARTAPHYRGMAALVVTATLFTSYPFAISLDRGQMEPIMTGLVLLFLVLFIRRQYWLAAFSLALASCLKPYPAVFFMLFFYRRRYLEILAAGASVVFLNLLGLAGMGSSVREAYAGIQQGMQWFMTNHAGAIAVPEIGMDHTLLALLKRVIQFAVRPRYINPDMLQALSRPYLVFCAGVGLISLIRLRNMPALNQFFALTVITVFLPWVSYDYTLIELYLPWGLFLLFLLHDAHRAPSRNLLRDALLVLLPCAVVFTPQSYLLLSGGSGYGGQVKSAALLVLLLATLTVPMPSSVFGDGPPELKPE